MCVPFIWGRGTGFTYYKYVKSIFWIHAGGGIKFLSSKNGNVVGRVATSIDIPVKRLWNLKHRLFFQIASLYIIREHLTRVVCAAWDCWFCFFGSAIRRRVTPYLRIHRISSMQARSDNVARYKVRGSQRHAYERSKSGTSLRFAELDSERREHQRNGSIHILFFKLFQEKEWSCGSLKG